MYDRMKNMLTRNLPWKAFSVIIASFLWFLVININNPTEIKTFNIRINAQNEDILYDNDLVVLNLDELKNTRISTQINATRPTLAEISSKLDTQNVNFTVDLSTLSKYTIGDEPSIIPIAIKPTISNLSYSNNSFEVLSFEPATVDVIIDKIITVPKKIHAKVVGNLQEGYVSSTPVLSAEYIEITGPKSVVNSIQVVYTEIDVTDKVSTIEEAISPIAYDTKGDAIDGLEYFIEDITVRVPISKEGSIPVENPEILGTVPDGYILKSVSYSPRYINVLGTASNINSISVFPLPAINISNLTETTTFSYDVSEIMKSYNLVSLDNETSIIVTVLIEKASTRNFVISKDNVRIIGENPEFSTIIPNEISVSLTGELSKLNNLSISDINCSLNVSGLGEEVHQLNLNVSLPDGISLVNSVTVPTVILSSDIQPPLPEAQNNEFPNFGSFENMNENNSEDTNEEQDGEINSYEEDNELEQYEEDFQIPEGLNDEGEENEESEKEELYDAEEFGNNIEISENLGLEETLQE